MNAPAAPRSRLRRWSLRLGAAGFALGALLGAVLAWLLLSAGGRDTLLAQITARLPEGALQWERAEGALRGPLVLHGVRYAQDGVELRARRLMLDPDLLPLLGRRLQLDALELDDAVLVLPEARDEPFSPPEWPGVLPRIPLPLDIRSARVDVAGLEVMRGEEALLALDTLAARGLHLVDEGFTLTSLDASGTPGHLQLKGEYRPARDYRSVLTARWSRPATDDSPAAALQASVQGRLQDLRIEASGELPGRSQLAASVQGDADAPRWSLQAGSQGLAPALLGLAPGEHLAFELKAEGTGGEAGLSGRLARGETTVQLAPSRVSVVDDRLRLDPLDLVLDGGALRVTGELTLDDTLPFDLRARTDALQLPSDDPAAPAVVARGEARVQGVADDWSLDAAATLARDGEQATITLAGQGDREQLQLARLQADTPGGGLQGSGALRWAPATELRLDARLQALDPGYFLPGYPGRLDGELALQATQDEAGQWRGQLRLPTLSGQLRQRPLLARADLRFAPGGGDGEASIRLGDSELDARGRFGDDHDFELTMSPLALSDLAAGAAGRLEGRLRVRGPAASPGISADLRGQALAWDDQEAASLTLRGDLPARGEGGELTLRAAGLSLSGLQADELALDARGSRARLELQAQAHGPHGRMALAGTLAQSGGDAVGTLSQLLVEPAVGPRLALQAPADFRVGPARLQLARACLRAGDTEGRLCVQAEGSALDVGGDALPLALAAPWLPADEGVPLTLDGTVSLQAALRRDGDGQWRGDGRLASARGALRLDPESRRDLFGYENLVATLLLDGSGLGVNLEAALAEGGRLSGRLQRGTDDDPALDGELRLDARELSFLELFSEDLAAPRGRLAGQLQLAGRESAPVLSGQARLAGFAAELPALGLKLAEGDFEFDGPPEGLARLSGSLRSGEGRLRVDGSLDLRDPQAPLQLTLEGERVTFASTPELYLIASPKLSLAYAQSVLRVRGQVDVPEARVDLELLDGSASVSPDVVVLDPVDPDRGPPLPTDLDVRVSLGDEVKLRGFGLDGRMGGALTLRQRPDRAATASGTLDVTGSYRAYGQALDIRRARLSYTDSAFDNPGLDIRAERKFDEVTVGVQVRGTARRPETTVTSAPAMDTSEALSWLVFGRPLRSTSGAESQQLDAAAMALGAGGNLVAQQIGARLGLDEAGVAESRNLGGAALTVGKYLSPRLFISYGVSLVGTGQVVTLKYLLARGFDISVESGNENAASLNWRHER
ncbi:translocation/assembly module TamB domain-containing protein [Arenimonas caeni]|uniref:translocation/assembly module TamB domain-containing protein n=1 Tax=Arenimonas caeni TaxID=2058085 RepID=UPI002A3689A4|nr:translocation/assembly module TamB domain-containing protein [Arenimonas caeni]MDY0020878.1 translocation/assembly module TamB domain-containing protein [Arenimonas caeni]